LVKKLLTNSTALECNHIFCNTCISEWFSREKTCPICRKTAIGRGEEKFVDGSSEIALMLF
jgi:E3 ubiquitin-protein ligase RNFT1